MVTNFVIKITDDERTKTYTENVRKTFIRGSGSQVERTCSGLHVKFITLIAALGTDETSDASCHVSGNPNLWRDYYVGDRKRCQTTNRLEKLY